MDWQALTNYCLLMCRAFKGKLLPMPMFALTLLGSRPIIRGGSMKAYACKKSVATLRARLGILRATRGEPEISKKKMEA